jgi:hypothetical protein
LIAKHPDVILKPCAAVFVALPVRFKRAAARKPEKVEVADVFVALKVSDVSDPPKKPLPLTEKVVNGEEVPTPTKLFVELMVKRPESKIAVPLPYIERPFVPATLKAPAKVDVAVVDVA